METATLQRDSVRQAGDVLARAFQDDPLYAYILPDDAERRQRLPDMFAALVKYSLLFGACTTTPELAGVASWLRPGSTEVTFWRVVRAGLGLQTSVARFSREARERFMAVMGYADATHKQLMQEPHWYLWALGVEPGRQGQGIGSALLRPGLDWADEAGVPCYLETQTERNAAFYQRRGFRILKGGDIPGHGVPFWAMVRQPARRCEQNA